MKDHDLQTTVNFLFEVGILAQTPRSYFQLLGRGHQSVAEHINRVCYITLVMSLQQKGIDTAKALKMALLHDLAETRIGDLHYVQQKYAQRHEDKVIKEIAASVPFGSEIEAIIHEYEERQSAESILVKDADTLEFIISLKEQIDQGSPMAATWVENPKKRLKTYIAKQLADRILATPSDEWWFGNKNDEWWVNRGKAGDGEAITDWQ